MLARTLVIAALLVGSACDPVPSSGTGPDDVDLCAYFTDDETVAHFALTDFHPDVQLQPGEEHQFHIFTRKGSETIRLCETWSVSPVDAGATIDENGLLKIGSSVSPGEKFVVTAHVNGDGPTISMEVFVYTPSSHPLVGQYSETTQMGCGTGERDPENPVGELEFRASGRYYVTWIPYDTYIDYSGEYLFDPATGMLRLDTPSGNHVPADFDGVGTASMIPGQGLVLRNIWLGTFGSAAVLPSGCGHTFN